MGIIGDSKYLIAEIGINHNGDLKLAKEMVRAAKNSGADAVKFQKRTPEICVPGHMKSVMRETPWGQMTYLEYKKRLEFGEPEFEELRELAYDLEVDFSVSAWDLPSLEFVMNYDLSFSKVASALATNDEFLRALAQKEIPIVASTGMCTIAEIDNLVEILRPSNSLILMHSVSTYPADVRDLNLRVITTLQKRYALEVGYSGHEVSVSPSIVAATLGARVIERHFTVDRSLWGTDQSASLEPEAFKRLSGSLSKIRSSLGDGVKRITAEEQEVARKLRYW